MPSKTKLPKVKWEEPRESKATTRYRTERYYFVEVLKTRPGKWALYRENLKYATDVTNGKRLFPEVEWTSRQNEDGTFNIYARYKAG